MMGQQVEQVLAPDRESAAHFLAMAAPPRSIRLWHDWLAQRAGRDEAILLGMRAGGQWVGLAQLVRVESAFAGSWQAVADIPALVVHPGMRRPSLVRPLVAAATAWARGSGAVALRCDEAQWGPLAAFGFVPQAPVIILANPPEQFAYSLKSPSVRYAESHELPAVAALYEARARLTTGLDRRDEAAWQAIEAQLVPQGPMRLVVAERDGAIEGYALYQPEPGAASQPVMRVLEWVDTGEPSLRALAHYLHQLKAFSSLIRLPLWSDRPRSLLLGGSSDCQALLRRGPSLLVVDPAPLLAAHLPEAAWHVGIAGQDDLAVYRVAEGRAVPTEAPADVVMSRRVLGQLVGGDVPIAEALSLGMVEGAAEARAALQQSWRTMPFCRTPFD